MQIYRLIGYQLIKLYFDLLGQVGMPKVNDQHTDTYTDADKSVPLIVKGAPVDQIDEKKYAYADSLNSLASQRISRGLL